jgi:hypothetical protein
MQFLLPHVDFLQIIASLEKVERLSEASAHHLNTLGFNTSYIPTLGDRDPLVASTASLGPLNRPSMDMAYEREFEDRDVRDIAVSFQKIVVEARRLDSMYTSTGQHWPVLYYGVSQGDEHLQMSRHLWPYYKVRHCWQTTRIWRRQSSMHVATFDLHVTTRWKS